MVAQEAPEVGAWEVVEADRVGPPSAVAVEAVFPAVVASLAEAVVEDMALEVADFRAAQEGQDPGGHGLVGSILDLVSMSVPQLVGMVAPEVADHWEGSSLSWCYSPLYVQGQ